MIFLGIIIEELAGVDILGRMYWDEARTVVVSMPWVYKLSNNRAR